MICHAARHPDHAPADHPVAAQDYAPCRQSADRIRHQKTPAWSWAPCRSRTTAAQYFKLPVNRPVYFQALDADGLAVQSMRSRHVRSSRREDVLPRLPRAPPRFGDAEDAQGLAAIRLRDLGRRGRARIPSVFRSSCSRCWRRTASAVTWRAAARARTRPIYPRPSASGTRVDGSTPTFRCGTTPSPGTTPVLTACPRRRRASSAPGVEAVPDARQRPSRPEAVERRSAPDRLVAGLQQRLLRLLRESAGTARRQDRLAAAGVNKFILRIIPWNQPRETNYSVLPHRRGHERGDCRRAASPQAAVGG